MWRVGWGREKGAVDVPAESVYAVFEVKPLASRGEVAYAGEKVASVRALHRTSARLISGGVSRAAIEPRPILGGFLAAGSVWSAETLGVNIRRALAENKGDRRIDLGCCLAHGSFETFENRRGARVSRAEDSLIFFILRLLDRLQGMGTAPAADLMEYWRSVKLAR